MPAFYKIVDDAGHATAWWLGEVQLGGKKVDPDKLTSGICFETSGRLTVGVKRRGDATAFGFALGLVPVVSIQAADVISHMAPGAIERIPIDIEGIRGKYEALNIVRVVDAIDPKRSTYSLWGPEDNRPDRLGDFRSVDRLVIKDDVRQDVCIFRPLGWEVVLIVSAKLRKALDALGNLGILFRPLEGGFSAN